MKVKDKFKNIASKIHLHGQSDNYTISTFIDIWQKGTSPTITRRFSIK